MSQITCCVSCAQNAVIVSVVLKMLSLLHPTGIYGMLEGFPINHVQRDKAAYKAYSTEFLTFHQSIAEFDGSQSSGCLVKVKNLKMSPQ